MGIMEWVALGAGSFGALVMAVAGIPITPRRNRSSCLRHWWHFWH